MNQLDIDRLSDDELTDLTTKLCRQVITRRRIATPLAIRGDDQMAIGFLITIPASDPGDVDPEFLAELRRRIANPPERYLSVDEFLGALDDYWSRADTAARQLDSANGHVGRAG